MGGVLMRDDLPATTLLEAAVVEDPYAFYRRLVAEAPVWHVPGTRGHHREFIRGGD